MKSCKFAKSLTCPKTGRLILKKMPEVHFHLKTNAKTCSLAHRKNVNTHASNHMHVLSIHWVLSDCNLKKELKSRKKGPPSPNPHLPRNPLRLRRGPEGGPVEVLEEGESQYLPHTLCFSEIRPRRKESVRRLLYLSRSPPLNHPSQRNQAPLRK